MAFYSALLRNGLVLERIGFQLSVPYVYLTPLPRFLACRSSWSRYMPSSGALCDWEGQDTATELLASKAGNTLFIQVIRWLQVVLGDSGMTCWFRGLDRLDTCDTRQYFLSGLQLLCIVIYTESCNEVRCTKGSGWTRMQRLMYTVYSILYNQINIHNMEIANVCYIIFLFQWVHEHKQVNLAFSFRLWSRFSPGMQYPMTTGLNFPEILSDAPTCAASNRWVFGCVSTSACFRSKAVGPNMFAKGCWTL